MKRHMALSLLLVLSGSYAQTYILRSISTNAGGTSRLTSGAYTIGCSIGQSVAGRVANSFAAHIGFWTPPIVPYVGIEESAALIDLGQPAVFRLRQNYPNPVSYRTTIKYDLPCPCEVALSLFDATGRQVAVLVSEKQNAGYYEVAWDLRTITERRFANGVYFYCLEAGDFRATRKLILCQ